jgi:hypothetical protein
MRLLYVLILPIALLAPSIQAPVEVEPADLAKRKDLIGREVVVDDRAKFYFPVPNKEPEIILERTLVTVVLAPGLSYGGQPSGRSVRVQGVLRRRADGSGLEIQATKLPERWRTDVHRLKAVMAALSAEDAEARSGWGDWAAKRADAFDDDELRTLAIQLQTEAIELEYKKPRNRTPEAFLALAKKARTKRVSEPLPSAIAHMGFRLRLASVKTIDDFQRIADDVKAFLPDSKTPAKADVRLPVETYDADPYTTYRGAPRDVRWALDRRLWTDARAEVYRLRAVGKPDEWKALGEEAKAELPDRAEIGGELVRRFYKHRNDNVINLKKSEMLDLASNADTPADREAIQRKWLDHQRTRVLTPDDSDQRVELAKDYLNIVKDKSTWAALLQEALEIDASNSAAEDQLRRGGYVKTNGVWHDPKDPNKPPEDANNNPADGREDPLIGLTPTEVKAQLGEPKTVSRIASRDRICIQWIYEGTRGSQYIDFVQDAGHPQPVVTGRFSVR